MVLMLTIAFLMAAARFSNLVSEARHRQQGSPVRHHRLAVLALSAAAGLISVPSAAWAHAPVTDGQAQIQNPHQNSKTTAGAATTTSARSAIAEGYAAREASSKNLENFAGGDTSIYIGGSALVIIVVVLLILIII